uniref:Uncharacterized protein n=1 Tax=Arundo donax TaxID=35708 RepID=A0A0A9BNX2_ARUDO
MSVPYGRDLALTCAASQVTTPRSCAATIVPRKPRHRRTSRQGR